MTTPKYGPWRVSYVFSEGITRWSDKRYFRTEAGAKEFLQRMEAGEYPPEEIVNGGELVRVELKHLNGEGEWKRVG